MLIACNCHELSQSSPIHFFLNQRSMLKDYCPGFYDPNPGGVGKLTLDITNHSNL